MSLPLLAMTGCKVVDGVVRYRWIAVSPHSSLLAMTKSVDTDDWVICRLPGGVSLE